MLRISALSLEYVRVPVRATSSGAAVDPTGDTVVMAFVSEGASPSSSDWKTAGWESDTAATPDSYYARCLIGPAGTVTLAAGIYDAWVKITDSPEVPALRAGNVQVF